MVSVNHFKIQYNVIIALFLRELKTRFGKSTIGYFWPFLEPLAHITILSFVFSFRGSDHSSGLNFILIFVTGIIPYLLFQNITSRSANAIESNRGLFNYRQVKPLDTITARSILEVVIYSIILTAMLVVLDSLLGMEYRLNNLLMVYISISSLVLFSYSLGVMFMVMGSINPESKKIIPMIMKPMYFISGIFFTASEVPEGLREYLLLNPIFNMIEWIRYSTFVEMGSYKYYDVSYILAITLVFFSLSMALYKKYSLRIIMS